MMLATERIVFVTGPEDSDRFIENLRTDITPVNTA